MWTPCMAIQSQGSALWLQILASKFFAVYANGKTLFLNFYCFHGLSIRDDLEIPSPIRKRVFSLMSYNIQGYQGRFDYWYIYIERFWLIFFSGFSCLFPNCTFVVSGGFSVQVRSLMRRLSTWRGRLTHLVTLRSSMMNSGWKIWSTSENTWSP